MTYQTDFSSKGRVEKGEAPVSRYLPLIHLHLIHQTRIHRLRQTHDLHLRSQAVAEPAKGLDRGPLRLPWVQG